MIESAKQIVLDIGNCGPDFSAIRSLLESEFDVQVMQAHGAEDAIEILSRHGAALITVNRKLDRDYSDGIDVIRTIKSDERFATIPVMMITNYEEHQQTAMAAGAVKGFGKLQLRSDQTKSALAAHLSKGN